MDEMITEPVRHASAWHVQDAQESWFYQLTAQEVREVYQATNDVLAKVDSPEEVSQEEFPLPQFGKTLAQLRDEVEYGRGFTVVRGLPVGEFTVEQNTFLFAGLLAHLGKMIVSTADGCLIDEVIDRGLSYEGIEVRGYQTNAHLTPHCDSGDIVALLCLRAAKHGGTSMIMSFISVYNEIVRNHPEYLPILYRGFHYNIRGGGHRPALVSA